MPRPRLDLHLTLRDGDVEVTPTWNGSETAKPHRIGSGLRAELPAFTAGVAAAAREGARIEGELLQRAKRLHGALLAEGAKLPAGEPLLIRLFTGDRELREVPWEALCEPGSERRFLGSSASALFARGAYSRAPCAAWPVRDAVRVLVVSPTGKERADRIHDALAEPIETGEVRWVPPVVETARRRYILDGLLQSEELHVLHFVGHGGHKGEAPVLVLAEEDGEEGLLHVERLAEELESRFRRALRLVVLESCEGAAGGSFASAAEMLAAGGADAVVANLWRVEARVAADFSRHLYHHLAGKSAPCGDVALAMNEARRRILVDHEESAAAFAPVLYLRGPDSVLFEYGARRRVRPPEPTPPPPADTGPPEQLTRLLRKPAGFSLLVGDRRRDDRLLLDAFQRRLEGLLEQRPDPPLGGLPLSAVAQRFALEYGEPRLLDEFHVVFETTPSRRPLLETLAGRLKPGVHVTLLHLPELECAIARAHPDAHVYVIRPPAPGEEPQALGERPSIAGTTGRASPSTLLHRVAGAANPQEWRRLDAEPPIDTDEDFLILRLYRGYLPPEEEVQARYPPLLTEDDYLRGVRDLDRVVSPDLANDIRGGLLQRPMVLLGLSALEWQHRMLLHRLLGARQVPPGSIAVLEPGGVEKPMWKSGTFLPGKLGLDVVEASTVDLLTWLQVRSGR